MQVSAERFEELTSQAIEALPEWVKQQMDNVYGRSRTCRLGSRDYSACTTGFR